MSLETPSSSVQKGLLSLIGNVIITSSLKELNAEHILKGKTVLLLFSASWCPPCSGFLDAAIAWYQSAKNSNIPAEIVYISSDRNEMSFQTYFKTMPWFALPFQDRARKAILSRRYRVTGIPALVVVREDGSLITREGRHSLMKDPSAFPWLPPSIKEVLGDVFYRNDMTVVHGSEFFGSKYIGLFFSSSWCPPCIPFTQELIKISETVNKKYNNQFQIIYVSTDKGRDQFEKSFSAMPLPFLALPYDLERTEQLSQILAVESVPQLCILDKENMKVINRDGRSAVMDDAQGLDFPWKVDLVNKLKGRHAQTINSCTSLILLAQEGVMTEQEILDALLPAARECEKNLVFDDDFLYFYGLDDSLSDDLRAFANDYSNPTFFIVNISQNLKFIPSSSSSSTTKNNNNNINNNNNNNNNNENNNNKSKITSRQIYDFVMSYSNGTIQAVSL